MAPLSLAGGSWIFLAFVLILIVAVAYGYYSVKGSGIDQHGWKDRDRVFGTGAGKDASVDVRTWGRGSASSRPRRRMTGLEQQTAAAIAENAPQDRDPTWRTRVDGSAQLAAPIDPERDHARGAENAAVTLVEYGEYECRYCKEAHDVLTKLERRFGDDLSFVYRHFPQRAVHPHARDGAVAVEAAARQGAFWEMHDRLAGTKKALEPALIQEMARKVGLDMERFEADLQDPALVARVDEDQRSGLASGVNGTPTFFLNGVRYDDDFDEAELGAAVEAARAVAKEHQV